MSQRPGQTCRASFLLFPQFCQDSRARCPGPSWVRALVWRWTSQHMMFLSASQTSLLPVLQTAASSPAEPAVSSVCTWDDTVSCRSSVILVRSATLSGFCLNFSSNKKLTPPQSSHSPELRGLKKSLPEPNSRSLGPAPQRKPFTGQVSALTPPPFSLPTTGLSAVIV